MLYRHSYGTNRVQQLHDLQSGNNFPFIQKALTKINPNRCLTATWLKVTLKSLCMFSYAKYILKEEIKKLKLEMTAAKNGILNTVGLFSSVTCNC